LAPATTANPRISSPAKSSRRLRPEEESDFSSPDVKKLAPLVVLISTS
jgi:hypothetical protein